MPLFAGSHHGLASLGGSSSHPPSRPSSRPASPTRANSWGTSHVNSDVALFRSRENTRESDSLGTSPPVFNDMFGYHVAPVEIILDSDHLVMRGQGGDMNPAYLSGRVDLNLHEPANIKEISMSLTGKAKVGYTEGIG